MKEIEIRQANTFDGAAIEKLWSRMEMHHDELDPVYKMVFAGVWSYQDYIRLVLKEARWSVRVAVRGHSLVGFCIATSAKSPMFYQVVEIPSSRSGEMVALSASSRLLTGARIWLDTEGVVGLNSDLEVFSDSCFGCRWEGSIGTVGSIDYEGLVASF